MKKVIKLLATGFKTGLTPVAPGTAGTLVAVAGLWLVMVLGLIKIVDFPLLFILVVVGTYIAQEADKLYEIKDAPQIVIDEIVGFAVAMAGLQMNMLVPAFVLFRFFDIYKPDPLDRLQEFEGGIGIMLDDIGAGIAANILLRIVLYFV